MQYSEQYLTHFLFVTSCNWTQFILSDWFVFWCCFIMSVCKLIMMCWVLILILHVPYNNFLAIKINNISSSLSVVGRKMRTNFNISNCCWDYCCFIPPDMQYRSLHVFQGSVHAWWYKTSMAFIYKQHQDLIIHSTPAQCTSSEALNKKKQQKTSRTVLFRDLYLLYFIIFVEESRQNFSYNS